MTIKTGLYGHTSFETAYTIDDYPYGRTERCRRRVWIEHKKNKGYRFVAQTEHPRKKIWNKPHASTYVDVAACLYLDENDHVEWSGVGFHTTAEKALEFARAFGNKCEGAEALLKWANDNALRAKGFAEGKLYFTINGVRQERSEFQREEDLKEAAIWLEVVELMKG